MVGRPRSGHRFIKPKLGLVGRNWLNWRPGGALRWKVETDSWEGQRVVCDKMAPPRP
jgi:hypothetical protein